MGLSLDIEKIVLYYYACLLQFTPESKIPILIMCGRSKIVVTEAKEV